MAEAVASGLTVAEYAPTSTAREEFRELAKAVEQAAQKVKTSAGFARAAQDLPGRKYPPAGARTR